MYTFRHELLSRILLFRLAVLVFILSTYHPEFQGVDFFGFRFTVRFKFLFKYCHFDLERVVICNRKNHNYIIHHYNIKFI